MTRLLRPPWLLGHVVAVALVTAQCLLGRWQWHRAFVHHHSLRNFSYAVEWWLFAAFTLALWVRTCRDAVQGVVQPVAAPVDPAPSWAAAPTAPAAPTPDEDPELAAYNAYLASLHRDDESSRT